MIINYSMHSPDIKKHSQPRKHDTGIIDAASCVLDIQKGSPNHKRVKVSCNVKKDGPKQVTEY